MLVRKGTGGNSLGNHAALEEQRQSELQPEQLQQLLLQEGANFTVKVVVLECTLCVHLWVNPC